MSICIRNLYKSFGNNHVLKNININIKNGESIVIVGTSGTGKSVLLKIIAGMLSPSSGEIIIDNQDAQSTSTNSNIGFMFQGCALFDFMSIYENVRFYLDYHNIGNESHRHNTAVSCLKYVGIERDIHLKTSEISGGMAKRVALARILAYKPKIIIFDEPTSGLDPKTAKNVVDMLKKTWQDEKCTTITVTHDMYCANHLGQRIFVKENDIIVEAKNKNILLNTSLINSV
ncbi:MAG: ATP-binding cassette domain-containing protein [Chlamydiia bacterium]|nr:ATP-binding cassette domain-containing protein [Chlamydiia bacterium]